MGTADGTVVQASGATAPIIGVSDELDAAADERVDVHVLGVARVVAGGTLSRGTLVTSDAQGRAVAAAPSTGANAYVAGVVLVAAAAGDIVPVLLTPGNVIQG